MESLSQRKKILLASVLKPCDEPRMFERMGQTLAANGFEVFIAGFPLASDQSVDHVHFLPHEGFNRISIDRIRVRFDFLNKVISIRPDVFIVTTHELLGVALLYKLATGKKIVYDVQENYWLNILHTSVWPKLLRPVIASLVRLKEIVVSPFLSKFILAERCYIDELPFTKSKMVVIENKCRIPDRFQRKQNSGKLELLFTGTIGTSTGIFEAINLARKLNQVDKEVRLTIIGHCAQASVFQKLTQEISNASFIQLIGGEHPVSHREIMNAIATADFGIVFYPTSPHTQNKIPTKLYEYLSCRLPVLLQNNSLWAGICQPCEAVIVTDFEHPDVEPLLTQMKSKVFYTNDTSFANWQSEEAKLLTAIRLLV